MSDRIYIVGCRHYKYAIWIFRYGYGTGCWSGLGYRHIWTPLDGFGLEYGQIISIPFSCLVLLGIDFLSDRSETTEHGYNYLLYKLNMNTDTTK